MNLFCEYVFVVWKYQTQEKNIQYISICIIMPLWLLLSPIQQCCIKAGTRCSSESNKCLHTQQWGRKLWNQLRNVQCHIITTIILQVHASIEKRTISISFKLQKYTPHVFIVDKKTCWSGKTNKQTTTYFYWKLCVSQHFWLVSSFKLFYKKKNTSAFGNNSLPMTNTSRKDKGQRSNFFLKRERHQAVKRVYYFTDRTVSCKRDFGRRKKIIIIKK